MKKTLFGIILLLVLLACAPAAEKPAEEPTAAPTEPTAAPTPVTTEPTVGVTPPPRTAPSERQPAPAPTTTTTTTTTQEMSPKLRDLLKRAEEKIITMQYLYGGTPTGNLFLDTYQIKGTKMKIKKYEESYYVREGYYDTIYVDLGLACCEELSRCKSHNIDNTGIKFDVDVSTLNIPKTPYQWTKEVKPAAVIIGPQTVNDRSVTYIKYTDDNGQEVQMWIDDTYGVPHKVVITDANGNEIKHQFNDVQFNSLKDSDFNPPCA